MECSGLPSWPLLMRTSIEALGREGHALGTPGTGCKKKGERGAVLSGKPPNPAVRNGSPYCTHFLPLSAKLPASMTLLTSLNMPSEGAPCWVLPGPQQVEAYSLPYPCFQVLPGGQMLQGNALASVNLSHAFPFTVGVYPSDLLHS